MGLTQWDPLMLSPSVPDAGIGAALFGAASVFMAYEGFQLLIYDYKDIDNPQKILPRAVLSASAVVIVVYVIVALGTVMLIGADQVVQHKEVALAIAGQKAFGTVGLIILLLPQRSPQGRPLMPRSLPLHVLRTGCPRMGSYRSHRITRIKRAYGIEL
jgi:amino acid transporter